MRSGDSDRIEYLKQPHIIVLMVFIILVIFGAIFTATRKATQLKNNPADTTEAACQLFISDENLCKFAAASERSTEKSYRSVLTLVDNSGTTITTTDYENIDRSKWTIQQNGQQIDAFILYDADGYVFDKSDGVWAHYRDPEFAPTLGDSTLEVYDFSSAESEDVQEFRDRYKFVREEDCGELTCFKYQITIEGDENTKAFMWFDTKDYLLRRYQTIGKDSTTNTQYIYEDISISVPDKIKTVSEDEFNKLLE